jgi:hypothetical protein
MLIYWSSVTARRACIGFEEDSGLYAIDLLAGISQLLFACSSEN